MVLLGVLGALASWGVAYIRFGVEEGWIIGFYIGFGVLCVAATLDAMTSYMELGDGSIKIRSCFIRREIAKSEIEKVSYAKGCPVTLQLETGRIVSVPSFGENSQGLTNSIRAWCKGN